MDAGPGINFFSVQRERLLFGVLGAISVPEVVHQEILRKAQQEERFAPAERVLRKVPAALLEIISDEVTSELAAAVHRMSGVAIADRVRSRKDLGETMVVAHAVVAAERGARVIVLIDDSGGRHIAAREAGRLRRLRETRPGIGSIGLISTATVLKRAAGSEFLPSKADMRELYTRMRALDDGLVPLEQTDLLSPQLWQTE